MSYQPPRKENGKKWNGYSATSDMPTSEKSLHTEAR